MLSSSGLVKDSDALRSSNSPLVKLPLTSARCSTESIKVLVEPDMVRGDSVSGDPVVGPAIMDGSVSISSRATTGTGLRRTGRAGSGEDSKRRNQSNMADIVVRIK